MKNTDLEKSVNRLQTDIEDSTSSIISELTEEIESLENVIDKLESEITEANERFLMR